MIDHLEISGRQTGKTHRLIQEAVDFMNSDPKNQSIIVAMNKSSVRSIKSTSSIQFTNTSNKDLDTYTYVEFFRNGEFRGTVNNSSTVKILFDEFDFMIPEYQDEFVMNLNLQSWTNYYFVTTPSEIRSKNDIEKHFDDSDPYFDFLLHLLSLNDFEYESKINYDFILDNKKPYLFSGHKYKTEVLGSFI